MNPSAKQLAHDASFQTFINCYLREIDSGVWHPSTDWQMKTGLNIDKESQHVIELQLTNPEATIAIGVSFRSRVGRHRLTNIYQQYQNQWGWQRLDTMNTILLLVNNIYESKTLNAQTLINSDDQKLELIARIIESHQVMSNYIKKRISDPRLQKNNFIESEQSILFGHWLHPTPKSRQGMHGWQHEYYTPELCAHFQLHFFAIDSHFVKQQSILDVSAETIIKQLMAITPNAASCSKTNNITSLKNTMTCLAIHPLQAQWLLHQDYIQELLNKEQLLDLGLLGPYFTPTSSVRTLYCEELDYMLKLSIPVKITNSMRINMRHELNAGVAVASLLRKCQFSKHYPKFQTINDPAYITVDLPGRSESGFETIIRDNPFPPPNQKRETENCENTGVLSIAAIVQEPLLPLSSSRLKSMVEKIAKRENLLPQQAALKWFEAYWQCAIEPCVRLYDIHGVALEVHQQNSLLAISNAYPTIYYYRDNQGFYLSQNKKKHLTTLEPLLRHCDELFYADSMIRDRFSYYLIVNQLFSVINRFALDGLLSEEVLLALTHRKFHTLLAQMKGPGITLINSILHRDDLPCKGNLLTRIDDLDELQVELELARYTNFKNPMKYLSEHSGNSLVDTEVHLESA